MKKFFYFSKGQRVGIAILLVLLLVVIAADVYLSYFYIDKDAIDWAQYKDSALLFESQLKEKELEWKQKWTSYPTKNNQWTKKQSKGADMPISLFIFDPNTIDSVDLIRLGFRPKVASNILKYRAKGGVFRTAEQFGKIYGITDTQFEQLKPYIQIERVEIAQQADSLRPKFVSNKKDTVLELNTADTTELQMIRGIGSKTANAIVNYRRKLGGFYSIEQLSEVKGITTETYQRIKDNFTVNPNLITPINVNKATAERLHQHPYLKNITLANAIYTYRRNKFNKLVDISELMNIDGIDEDWIAKMTPYLTFEK